VGVWWAGGGGGGGGWGVEWERGVGGGGQSKSTPKVGGCEVSGILKRTGNHTETKHTG